MALSREGYLPHSEPFLEGGGDRPHAWSRRPAGRPMDMTEPQLRRDSAAAKDRDLHRLPAKSFFLPEAYVRQGRGGRVSASPAGGPRLGSGDSLAGGLAHGEAARPRGSRFVASLRELVVSAITGLDSDISIISL
jgi:hypothetical protein